MANKNYGDNSQLAELIKYISDNMKFPLMGAGGGFAPIGTESYFDGTSAPQGWLLCNGQTLNITDYPELAAYFASHHGRSNYYGGNGTTTFGVPTCKGMPNSEGRATNEHIIGVWTDGKPLYEKTIDCGTLPKTAAKSVAHGISNLGKVISIDATSYSATNNIGLSLCFPGSNSVMVSYDTTNVILTTASDRSPFTQTYVTLRYTKTTDSAVAAGHSADGKGVFCIKATVAGDPNGHVYNTEEHVVGQWIDGKTLYEKTISCGALPNNTTKNVAHGISNLYRIICFSGYAYNPTLPQTLNIPHPGVSAAADSICVYEKDGNIAIAVGKDRRAYTECYITIRYTKTTD